MKIRRIIRKTITIAVFLAIFLLLLVIKGNPQFAEFYTNHISTKYISFISQITSNIPFSIYELTLLAIIILCVYFVISFFIKLFKRKFLKALNKLLSFVLFILISVDVYIGTASIAYGRETVKIPQYDQEVTQELIDATFEYFLEDYNTISQHFERNEDGTIISPYTFEETNNLLIEEFKKLDPEYFSEFTPKAKQLTFSNLFSELHFTGIFWAPTGEVNINKNLHGAELPHTMAHEIAHSKGVFRENDANLVAMYVTLTSENEYLRYSAYYHNFSSLLRIYQQTNYDKFTENYFRLDENIRKEYGVINTYWSEHDFLAKLGQWYNDLFLKVNGNKNGVDDYGDTSEGVDSGEKDENDNPIYVIKEHSAYSKLFFYLYVNR